MKIPNGEKAQIGDKLERYSLNLNHSKGKDKAIMFRDRLGITLDNKHILEQALLKSLLENEAIIYRIDQYGTHYDVKFTLTTTIGSSLILGCWIIRQEEGFPRLTNTYPINK
jgi:methyl coenzyme M reductase gamma subunit